MAYGDEILKEAEGLGEPETDGRVWSLEASPAMKMIVLPGDRIGWEPCEPDLVKHEPEFDRMTGTYLDVSRRAVHLNARQQQSGIRGWVFYPALVEPLGAR